MATSSYSGQAVESLAGLITAMAADPAFTAAVNTAVTNGGGTAGTTLVSGSLSAANVLQLVMSDGSIIAIDIDTIASAGVDLRVVSGIAVAPATLKLTMSDASTIDIDLAAIIPTIVATTNTFTASTWTLASTVNGVSATLTPAVGTIEQQLGFDVGGALVRTPVAAETPVTVLDSNTIDLAATGTRGHELSAELKIDTSSPGNVALTSSANGLKAQVTIPAETALTVVDTNTIDLTAAGLNGHQLSADIKIDTTNPGNVVFTSSANGLKATVTLAADVKITGIAAAATDGHYTATLSDGSTFNVDLTALKAKPATVDPLAAATVAAVGTSTKYAREDHAHPKAAPTVAVAVTQADGVKVTVDGVAATAAIPAGTIAETVGFNAAGAVVRGTAASEEIGRGTALPTDLTSDMFIVQGSTDSLVVDGVYWRTEAGGWALLSGSVVGGGGSSATTTEANLIAGANPPLDAIGADGDYYLDALDGLLYGPKAAGDWPTTGTPVGAAAADLNVIAGANHPLDTVGTDGDYYLDALDGMLYGPKAAGTWPATGHPVGVAASSLNTITGSGAPNDTAGADGDYYLDVAAATIYGPKAAGDWPLTGTTIGAGLANVVEDLTPQLGGDLDANGHAITKATQISTDVATLTGANVTADIAAHGGYTINLTANTTVTIPAGAAGVSRASTLRFVQDATGGRTVAWAGINAWLGGQLPTIDAAANSETFVTVFQHGARTIGVAPITVDAGITGAGATPPTVLWTGTQAEYDAITTKSATTVYVIR